MEVGRPVITFDLDGVLCRPPFGINPGGLRKSARRPRSRMLDRLMWFSEPWRYLGRRPMPGAMQALRECSEFAECVILTGRGKAARGATEQWMVRHLGRDLRLEMRPSSSETSAAFKLRRATELGSTAHVEDDPNTAQLLAPAIPVYLVDWKRNAGVSHANVVRVQGVSEAVERLHAEHGMGVRIEPGAADDGDTA